MDVMNDILSFSGEYRWLSNFWLVPIEVDGLIYPSTEHAYQALKFAPEHRFRFLTGTPAEAKRHKNMVMHEALPDWIQMRVPNMIRVTEIKYAEGSELANRLIKTGNRQLVEGNSWGDVYWGVCKGKGENRLGRLLMDRRTYLQSLEK